MTPAARIKATEELLRNIGISPVPMDATTGDYMRSRRYIGSKDRISISGRVYNVMRAHARLGWWLAQAGAEDTPRTRLITWLALGEEKQPAEMAELFDGSKYGPAALTASEAALVKKLAGQVLEHDQMPEAVRAECPPEYEERLRAVYGDDFLPAMQAMMEAAPLDIRANIRMAEREDVARSLAKDGIKTDPTPYSPWGLRVRGKAFLSKAKTFHKGLISIQDEGSQLIALICGAVPGMQVLDYCAGAGGKTLALAAAMKNKGRLVAMDLDGRRLEKARPRFKKAGVHDIIEVRPLSEDRHRKWLRRQKGAFDVVLADVPCSGSGTWRRNPDMRWRQHGPDWQDLLETQRGILDKIAPVVKPGGYLVYATCSLFTEENEAQIEDFLRRHEDYELTDMSEYYPDFCAGPMMRLSSYQHQTDGFFAARLMRKNAQ